jgi:hypothetical protein
MPQPIEVLQKRYRDLERQKIGAESDVRNLEQQLADAREEAERLFGTADVDALRDMLARMNEENQRRREEYQAHLDAIDASLRAAEAAHEAARAA